MKVLTLKRQKSKLNSQELLESIHNIVQIGNVIINTQENILQLGNKSYIFCFKIA